MTFSNKRFYIIACILCFSCRTLIINAQGTAELPAISLHPYGRYIINEHRNLEMISSAMHFGFSFEGKECKIYSSFPDKAGHNYFQDELDGVYQKKIRLEGISDTAIVIKALKNGTHSVWIYKTTEATTGPIIIQKITGKNIQPLTVPDAPLIEFIGNSITCGAAADSSETPCGTGVYHDQHNAYFAYGPRLSRALKVNFILSSVSGIGIYRNWNSDGPTMPQVYEDANLNDSSAGKWDFNLFTPKVVSIALGTNDFSKGDGVRKRLPFDSAAFVNNYIVFVKLVQSKYPAAQIALLSSPMVNGDARTLLQNCLTAVKMNVDSSSASKPIALFFFEPMHAHGCGGHPSVEEHGVMANELIPFFKKLL